MERSLDRTVRSRAKGRCEYCLLPQSASKLAFPFDHIIARQHGGRTTPENLALCCGRCNLHKGPNIAGIDPVTGQLTRLFNPRADLWSHHFRFDGATMTGLTDIGRTTIAVLALNQQQAILVRQSLIDLGEFPPKRLNAAITLAPNRKGGPETTFRVSTSIEGTTPIPCAVRAGHRRGSSVRGSRLH
jgi:hypothetical protein